MKLSNIRCIKKVFCSFWAIFLLTSCYGYKKENKRPLAGPESKQQVNEIWNGQIDEEWYDDTKTEFHISTAQEFAGLSNLVNTKYSSFVDKKIFVESDIFLNDLTNLDDWVEKHPVNVWNPIGTEGAPFKGVIDFQGHCVYGMYINNLFLKTKVENVGLFGVVELKTPDSPIYINNLQVFKSLVVVGQEDMITRNVGSVVGKITNGGVFAKFNGISNVFCDCWIVCKSQNVQYLGGISGYTQANIFNSAYVGDMVLENIKGKVGGISSGGAIPAFVINSYSTLDLKQFKLNHLDSGVISYHGMPFSCFYLKNDEKNGGFFAFGYARRLEKNENYLVYGNGTFSSNESDVRITPSDEIRWNQSSGLYGDNRNDCEVNSYNSLLVALNSFSFSNFFSFKKNDDSRLAKWRVDPVINNGYPLLDYYGK